MAKTPIEVLRQARERMVTTRREILEKLSEPFDGRIPPRLMESFIEIQNVIAEIDKAMEDERELQPNPHNSDQPLLYPNPRLA